MTRYLNYDVLEVSPNSREDMADSQHRILSAQDPGLGKRSVLLHDNQPRLTKPYLWTCQSKAEVVDFKAWLNVRRGRAVPFWVPSWRKDLLLTQDVAATDSSISIVKTGYTKHQFPARARRHLAFLSSQGSAYRKVLSSTESETSEALALSAALGFTFSRASWICFLHLVRLAADDLEIVWHTDRVAECAFSYVEVPEEAP